jgi:hypothetical protein
MSVNNINNSGFYVFDPVLNFNLSTYIDKNKIQLLLEYAMQLIQLRKRKKIKEKEIYLDIIPLKKEEIIPLKKEEIIPLKKEEIIPLKKEEIKESTDELQQENKELLDIVNKLNIDQINLYNLENGIIKFIENNKIDLFIKDKESIIKYLLDSNTYNDADNDGDNDGEDDDKYFNSKYKLSNFQKIKPEEYKIFNIENLSKDELEENNVKLIEEIEKITKNIYYLISITEQLVKTPDIQTVSNIIPLNIIPLSTSVLREDEQEDKQEDTGKNQQLNIVKEGGGKINEVFTLLNKLKNNLDGISSLTLEKEIPGGINLQIDDIKKILNNFKLTLELQAKPGNDNDESKYKKNWEYNLFEEIPEYKNIKYDAKKGFVTNPLKPSIPNETNKVFESDILIKIINDKEKYMIDKIKDISGIIGDILMFTKKLQDYKIKELQKTDKYNYTFTNIGEKGDLQGRITELKKLIEDMKVELEKKNKLKEYLNDQIFTEYLKKKEELINRPPTNKEQDLKDFKNLIFDNILTKPQLSLNDNGTIKDELKKTLDHMIDIRLKQKYNKGFFLDENNYENYEQVKTYIESFRNDFAELQRSQIKREDSNIDLNLFITMVIKYQKSNIDSRNNNYKKIIDKLDYMNKTYNKKDELKETIDKFENENPLYLENHTIYKSDTEFDMTKIDESIQNKKISIDKVIESVQNDITNLETELKTIEPLLKDYKENTNYENMININKNLFSDKIGLIHKKLLQINENIKVVFNLKEGIDDVNTLNIIENSIIHSQPGATPNWFLNKKQTGGSNYIFNIDNINKINDINDAMKKLLINTERYKSISTDLLESYVTFIKNIHSIIIYIYYKLTVLEDIKNNRLRITRKFNTDRLENLKRNISQIKRKNFDLIKEYFLKVITDILDKQSKLKNDNKENKYVKYDNTIKDSNGLLNLFILVHIESYYDKY